MRIKHDVLHTQAWGCCVYVQIGATGFLLGTRRGAPLLRVEVFRGCSPRFRLRFGARSNDGGRP